MLDILSEKHLERKQRIIISAIVIALAAQINISILADGFIMTLSLFILPVFLYFNDDINPILLCLGITFASPIFRGIILSIAGEAEIHQIIEFVLTDMAFYICYGITFYTIYWHRSYRNKGTFFFSIIICDYFANLVEISFLIKFNNYTITIFATLFAIALLRAFISCAVAYTYSYLSLLLQKDDHERRYYYFMWSTSAVKSEVYFMQKNIIEIENIMKNAYLLDKELSKYHLPKEYQHLSLDISRDVHEVKKDYQNIIKGLGTYFSVKNESTMALKDIFQIVLSYTRSIIQFRHQDIIILENNKCNLIISNYYYLLTIISNIVLNAVEAIDKQKKGTISVHTEELEDFIKIEISDNGPGIPDKMKYMIFKPGFSTKFDANGDIYRGIGLSHVRILMEEQYQGTITVCPNQPNGTTFTLLFRKNRFKLGDNT